jgi:hypothetical protein
MLMSGCVAEDRAAIPAASSATTLAANALPWMIPPANLDATRERGYVVTQSGTE